MIKEWKWNGEDKEGYNKKSEHLVMSRVVTTNRATLKITTRGIRFYVYVLCCLSDKSIVREELANQEIISSGSVR